MVSSFQRAKRAKESIDNSEIRTHTLSDHGTLQDQDDQDYVIKDISLAWRL
jgi:hypothetical protein